MPDIREGESRKEFVARLMNSEEAKKSFSDLKQRYAVANSIYDEYLKKRREKNKKNI